jgi:ABC-type lipoprotein export system ATPase subunit
MEGVSKSYQRGREQVVAIANASLTVGDGEFVALVGKSGSGKSTLLHPAGGLDVADEGRVILDGQDLATLSAEARAQLRRRHVGFVFQFFHLLPGLSVAENVALPLLLDGAGHTGERVAELLDQVGLRARADHLPGELSGGEMQRVAVARALVARPKVILADEPTGNLDSVTGEAVLDLLVERVAASGATLVLVTHDHAAAARADRVLTVCDGALV